MAANPINIHHPKSGAELNHHRFVVSGLASDGGDGNARIDFVTARLIDQEGHHIVGHTIFDGPKWGIAFGVPQPVRAGQYTLEVMGFHIDPATGVVTAKRVSQPLNVNLVNPVTTVITWPQESETVCESNFVPYGTYSPPGTISVSLTDSSTPDAETFYADNVYQDPSNNFWSAQFDFSSDPVSPCTVNAENEASAEQAIPVTSVTVDTTC